jgi:3-phenylpropionate/cinnamic acid dioxygenase small subunit
MMSTETRPKGRTPVSCDHCAIKNLIYRYAHHIDDGDLDAVAAMFEEGRIVAVDGQGRQSNIVGAEAVLALYRSFTRIYDDNATPHTLHMTSNVLIDVEAGGGRASASSYAMVFQALDTFPLQPIIGVRYHDRFVRADAGWRFAERRIDTHLVGDLSRHLLRSSRSQS